MTSEEGAQEINADDFYKSEDGEGASDSSASENAESKSVSIAESKADKVEEGESDKGVEDDSSKEAQKEEEGSDELVLKLPEESYLDAKSIEDVKAFAKENSLSSEQAQGILDRENKAIQAYAEANETKHEETIEQWAKEVREDPEIGGDKFNESVELSKRVVHRFGSDALISELNETGYGNHPELVRFLTKLGGAMSNDTLELPGTSTTSKEKPLEDYFYKKQE